MVSSWSKAKREAGGGEAQNLHAHAESCYKRARVARRAVPRAPTRGGWDPGVRTAG